MPAYCVVPPRGGLVSLLMMHFPGKFSVFLAAVVAFGVCAAARSQTPDSSGQNSSSSTQAPAPQNSNSQALNNAVYVSVDPLGKVRYDNRYDVSLGFAYDHMKAGPSLLQGANLGGLDANGSYWLTRNWGIEASGRGYVGTSGTAPNHLNKNGGDLQGPMVKQYFFVGGAEWLGPHNKHADLIAHAMFGGVYGNFEKDLLGNPPGAFDFYYNQIAPAGIMGGHIDLNRSEHWVFRITPDAIMTHYNFRSAPDSTGATTSYSQFDVNFAISVGLEYKFTGHKRPTYKNKNYVSGW